MSEYQYYEFLAVDRALTPDEQAEVSGLSSRTDPTPTRAVFTYSYSDFRGNPISVLMDYYDAMLYMANWGSRRLAFRLPHALIDPDLLAPYCVGDLVSTSVQGDHVLLDINFYELEGGDWIDGKGWLASLAQLRRDLLHGDFRALYLIWLQAALLGIDYEIEADAPEPPVPSGLHSLTAPLRDFVDFFEIGDDLLAVASEHSPKGGATAALDFEALIAQLSEEERNGFLLRMARGETHVGLQLVRRLEELAATGRTAHPVPSPQRTVAVLLEAVEDRARRRKAHKRELAEQARLLHLNELAQTEPGLWADVRSLIEQKKAPAYAEAVKILKELHALAEHRDERASFFERVRGIQKQYSTLTALKRRLKQAGFLPGSN